MNRRHNIVILGLALAAAVPLGCSGGGGGDTGQAASPAASANGASDTGGAPVSGPAARFTSMGGNPAATGAGGPGQSGVSSGMAGVGDRSLGSPMGSHGFTMGQTPAPAAAASKPRSTRPQGPPPGGINRDPFNVSWRLPPAPPYIFSAIQPIRLVADNVKTPVPPNTEVREVPTWRVSGIMSGDGVYAILEGNSAEPAIVKPGSQTPDGYRVVSITAESVKLQRREGNYLLTQIVPLTDVPVGTGAQTAAYRAPSTGGFNPGLNRNRFPGAPGGGGGGNNESDHHGRDTGASAD